MHRAYDEYTVTTTNTDMLSFVEWCEQRAQQSVQFDFWLKTLSLEIVLLLFIRAVREGNFPLYVESLTQVVPWMFALDHTHYSRWLPVHIRDMSALSKKHPAILAEFMAGNFVVRKTSNKFSAMAIDQCHEQNNATIKESGGAVGLTDNPGALRRWMVAGPEVARMITEYEDCTLGECKRNIENLHHDQRPVVQTSFVKDVRSLIATIEEMGNPFLEETPDLMVLDTRDIMDSSVGETVRKVETVGKEQYTKFVEERLCQSAKPITDVISKNKFAMFSRPSVKSPSRQSMQVAELKNDCNLFSRLYISCQTRDGDLNQFFTHENQAAPPSISSGGKLRLGTKADLLRCIESKESQSESIPVVNAKFLDGAAIVQMLNPGTAKTFQDYADTVFTPYVSSQLETAERVDVVWDVYIPDSLKNTTRQKRGNGVRRRVAPTTVIPKNWKDFLRVDENKTELFEFLSKHIISRQHIVEGKTIYATVGKQVVCSQDDADLSTLSPCFHEEADTRLLLHVADAAKKGCTTACVRTVDTDVVVLSIATFSKLKLDELWVAFGTGPSFRYIPIHKLAVAMDPRMCANLHVFHAFTGCDTVSSFGGRGKKTAWETWKVFPEVTEAFEDLLIMRDDISDKTMSTLERFVVLLYDRTSDVIEVNKARNQLFTKKSRTLDNIPPTQAALKQHIKRASYQANCWNQPLIADPKLPSPIDWGWRKESTEWQPLWTTLQEASQSCYELIHCGCKKGCTGRCKCKKAALKCTALCFCSGKC